MANIKLSQIATTPSNFQSGDAFVGVRGGTTDLLFDFAHVPTGGGLPLIGTGLTYTANTPLLDLSQTWSNVAVAFTALRLNVTNTASAAGSLLADLQVGGSSVFKVDKTGAVTITNGATSNTVNIQGGAQLASGGAFIDGTTAIMTSQGFNCGTNSSFSIDSLGFPSAGSIGDTRLYRDAAGIFAQRNSTNAQTLRVYNTFTDASNYERGVFDWTTTASVLSIGTQALGTGVSRDVIVGILGGTPNLRFQSGSNLSLVLGGGTFGISRESTTTGALRIDAGFQVSGGTAIPAGGAAGLGYFGTSTVNFGVYFGSGAPTVSAAKGSLYLRSDGSSTSTRAYINTDGGTTWTNLVTAA